jgi:hypothetical protein
LVALGAPLLATIYFAFTYSGSYRWLAELQLDVFESYGPALTFIFSLLMLLLPSVALMRLGQRVGLLPRPEHGETGQGTQEAARSLATQQRVAQVQPWLVLAAMGGTLTFVGVQQQLALRAGARLVSVRCEELEAQRVPDASWLEIEGRPIWDALLEVDENYGQFIYLPLVSRGWSASRPVGVVLRVDRHDKRPLIGPTYRGARFADGLSGMVRARYEQAGLNVTGALVLDVGRNPADRATSAGIFIIAGPILLLLGLVVTYLKWRRSRPS